MEPGLLMSSSNCSTHLPECSWISVICLPFMLLIDWSGLLYFSVNPSVVSKSPYILFKLQIFRRSRQFFYIFLLVNPNSILHLFVCVRIFELHLGLRLSSRDVGGCWVLVFTFLNYSQCFYGDPSFMLILPSPKLLLLFWDKCFLSLLPVSFNSNVLFF